MFNELESLKKPDIKSVGFFYVLELISKDNPNNKYIKFGISFQNNIKIRLYKYRENYDVRKYNVFIVDKCKVVENVVKAKYGNIVCKGNEYLDGSKITYNEVVLYVKELINRTELEIK